MSTAPHAHVASAPADTGKKKKGAFIPILAGILMLLGLIYAIHGVYTTSTSTETPTDIVLGGNTPGSVQRDQVVIFKSGSTLDLGQGWTKVVFVGGDACRSVTKIDKGEYDIEIITGPNTTLATGIRLKAKTAAGSTVSFNEGPLLSGGRC